MRISFAESDHRAVTVGGDLTGTVRTLRIRVPEITVEVGISDVPEDEPEGWIDPRYSSVVLDRVTDAFKRWLMDQDGRNYHE